MSWRHCFHAAEPEMVRASANLALASRAHHIARAILIGAQERASALGLLWLGGFGGVQSRLRALGVSRNGARRHQLRVVIRPIPITGPLPHVPRHVVEAVTVRRKAPYCGYPNIFILTRVLVGKMTLKG